MPEKDQLSAGSPYYLRRSLPASNTVSHGLPPGSARVPGRGYRKYVRVSSQKSRRSWDRREVRWLERERQGRGNEFPLPVGPSPRGDIPRSSTWGDPGEEPGTAARRLHPGYGCLPDIRPGTAHAPRKGAEEERRRRGRGGGAGRSVRVSLRRARSGWGCRQKCTGIPTEARAGRGSPAEAYGYPCEGRGQGGGRRRRVPWVAIYKEPGQGR